VAKGKKLAENQLNADVRSLKQLRSEFAKNTGKLLKTIFQVSIPTLRLDQI